MSDWKQVVEDGGVFWVHDTIGNVMKLSEESFIAMIPKVIKLGPFATPEQAMEAAVANRTSLDVALETFNDQLIGLSEEVKR